MKKLTLLFVFSILISCNSQKTTQPTVIDLKTLKTHVIGKDVQLVDVRTPEEYSEGHIDDATNINIMDSETFIEKMQLLDKEKPIYLYCKMGGRSKKASEKLKELGFKSIFDYSGGYSEWSTKNK